MQELSIFTGDILTTGAFHTGRDLWGNGCRNFTAIHNRHRQHWIAQVNKEILYLHVSVTVTLYQYLPEKWKGNLNNMWDQRGTDLSHLRTLLLKENMFLIYPVGIRNKRTLNFLHGHFPKSYITNLVKLWIFSSLLMTSAFLVKSFGNLDITRRNC